MIQSLYELGRALETETDYTDYFASYADPFAGFDGNRIVIVLQIANDVVTRSESIAYQSAHAGRYLYRKPKGARGAPLVATGPFYPVHSLDTEKQQATQLENVEKIMSRVARSIPDGKSVYFSSTAAKNEGLVKISELLYNAKGNKDTRYIYTVTVDGQFLGEIEALRNLLDEEAYTKYYEKSKGTGTCALSHEQDTEVWGRVDTLGFTVNDISFSRGGFDAKASYRMFPVSKPAVKYLEAARRFAFANLTDRFYTLEYLLIPRTIAGSPAILLEMAEHMIISRQDNTLTKKSIPIDKAGSLIEAAVASGELNQQGVLFDILYFQRNQAQLALQLHLQDIAPTRLKEISEAVNTTSQRYGRAFGYFSKKQDQFVNFRLNLGIVKDFFSEGKGLKVRFDPFFFRLLEAMFHAQSLNEDSVVAALIRKIQEAFKNDGDDYHTPFNITVQRAIATRDLLGRLGLFEHSTQFNMKNETKDAITLRRESFMTDHASFFAKEPALKGAFLLGILTSILTYAQYDHLKSKPFLNRLNNLNLGMEELRALVPQLLNKIQQYQNRKSGYSPSHTEVIDISAEASALLMQGKRPSRDDLSFAFSTGMVMQDKFALDIAREKKAEKAAKAETSTAP